MSSLPYNVILQIFSSHLFACTPASAAAAHRTAIYNCIKIALRLYYADFTFVKAEKRPGQIPVTSSKTGPVKEEEKGSGKIPVTGPVKTRDEILALLRNDPTMTIEEVCKKVGVTKRVTERHFERLKKDGIIKRIGSDKTGYWKILKEPGQK